MILSSEHFTRTFICEALRLLHKINQLSCDISPHHTTCFCKSIHVFHLMQFNNIHAAHLHVFSLQAICKLHLWFVQNVECRKHHDRTRQHLNDLIKHLEWVVVPVISTIWMLPFKSRSQIAQQSIRREFDSALVFVSWVVSKIWICHDKWNQYNQTVCWLCVLSSNCCDDYSQNRVTGNVR